MNKSNKHLISVLLVISDKKLYHSIKQLFGALGENRYELEWIKSSSAAHLAIQSGKSDVCLIDCQFGEKSVLQFLSEAVFTGATVPISLLTDDEKDEKFRLAAMSAGAAYCLPKKGLDAPLLEQAINYLLEKNKISLESQAETVKFRTLVETLPVMVYIVEPVPPYSPIYVSSLFEVFGYSVSDWRKSADFWVRSLHPDDRERVLRDIGAIMKAGGETDFEYRIITKDGTVRWVHDRGRCMRDEKGNIVCWQGIIFDITKSKRNEEELQKRKKIYRTLVRNMPQTAVIVFDRDLRYTVAEVSQFSDLGYTGAMFEDKSLWDVFPREISNEWAGYYRRALAGEVVSIERQNERGYFQVEVVPIKNECGEIFAGMVLWHDLTERKQGEAALKESDQRYRQMFEKNQAIKLLIDSDTQVIVDANPSACEFYGYTREEFKTKKITDLNTLPIEKVISEMRQAREEERDYFMFRHRLASGEIRDVEVHSSPIQNHNQNLLYSIIHDVTDRKRAENALIESEERYRDLFENANDLIYVHDLEGNYISVNRTAERVFGYTLEEALKMNVKQIIAPEYLEIATRMMTAKVSGAGQSVYEVDCLTKKDERITLEINSRAIYKDGVPFAIQGIARDVTQRRRTEEALKASEEQYRELFENANDLIYTHDLMGNFTSLNRAGEIITGYTREEAIEMNIKQVVAPEFLEMAYKMIYQKVNGGMPTPYELEIISKDGRRVLLELSTRLIYHDNQPFSVQGIARDISERRQAEEQVRHNALHDVLTSLPNRVKFMNHLTQAVEQMEINPTFHFAVLFLDLDRFKVINDSLGHSIGDKLLISIAGRLESCIRQGDTVARLGGDEFTILLYDVKDLKVPIRIANRLLEKLSAPFHLDGYEVFTSASIGIIFSDATKRQPEDYLRDADAAMYRAKTAGKARYEIFDREMHLRNMNLLQLETDLRRAIEQQEFEVYYQPIVRLEGGDIREFEALIRWNHPKHGLVMPGDFIGIAEETGLIVSIGEWILRESCRQIVEWQTLFPALSQLSVSVNLSAKQLMHPKLIEQVDKILMQTGLDPHSLKLEVTESVVMENSEKALAVISQLRAFNIALSTDDFGTGYSSLSYLHRFPFDRLKIDRSFVSKMDADEKSEAIVRTILLLGENLNIEVVAEGIETQRQLENLRLLGCHRGQGFLFSKPVPAGAAAQLLTGDLSNIGVAAFGAYSDAENHLNEN